MCGESTNAQQLVRLISSSPSRISKLIRHQSSHRPLIGINKENQQLQKWKLLKSRQKSASKLKLFLPNDIWNPFDGVLFNEKLHSTPFINNLNSKKVSINSSIFGHGLWTYHSAMDLWAQCMQFPGSTCFTFFWKSDRLDLSSFCNKLQLHFSKLVLLIWWRFWVSQNLTCTPCSEDQRQAQSFGPALH